jgi:phosphate transport system substrate-binding protein
MNQLNRLAGVVALALLGTFDAASAEMLRVGGTGSATEFMRALGTKFAAEGELQFEVIPSLGSNGGLRALEAGMLDIAVSGRKLNASEIAKGFTERAAVRSPWGLATSHPRPSGLRSTSIAAIYRDEQARWDDGTPIRVILRPRGETANQTFGEAFPGMSAALEQLRARTELPFAATDQDNANWAERAEGSLVAMTFTQILMERRKLRLVAIDGVEPTFENFETGRYRYGKTHYLVTAAQTSPAVLRFIAYVSSAQAQQLLRDTGNLLVPR